MVAFAELGTGRPNLVNLYYGDRWRLHRKLIHLSAGLQHIRKYRVFQNDESKVVTSDILSRPEKSAEQFERYATSVVSIIGFRRRVPSADDPVVTGVIKVMQRAAELNVPAKIFPMVMETFP